MNRCSHFFCFECIQKWAEVTNCCPLCKVPSLSLHKYGDKISRSGIVQKIRIKSKQQTYNYEDPGNAVADYADVCYECGNYGDDSELMVCDHCDFKICHFKCAGFQQVPSTNWFCKFCVERRPQLASMLNEPLFFDEPMEEI